MADVRPRIAEELGLVPRRSSTGRVVPRARRALRLLVPHGAAILARPCSACFTTSVDPAPFWGCHQRAFTHFGGVRGRSSTTGRRPMSRRHVAPGAASRCTWKRSRRRSLLFRNRRGGCSPAAGQGPGGTTGPDRARQHPDRTRIQQYRCLGTMSAVSLLARLRALIGGALESQKRTLAVLYLDRME